MRGHEPARLVGRLALELFNDAPQGIVVGAFSSALALEIRGLAITLTPQIVGLPLGVSLPSLPLSESRTWIGHEVSATSSYIAIDRAGWTATLVGAPVWDGNETLAHLAPTSHAMLRSSAKIEAWLGKRVPIVSRTPKNAEPATFGGPSDRTAGSALEATLGCAMAEVRVSLIKQDWEWLADAVARLLGTGPGLTPAGDDFLSGLALTLRAAGPTTGQHLPRLTDLIQFLAPNRTNLYGMSALHAACLGHASESVSFALASLLNGSPDYVSRLEQLASFGASSGIDTLHGILAGLQILTSQAQG